MLEMKRVDAAMEQMAKLARVLAERQRALGLNDHELAERTGLSKGVIWRLRTGRKCAISLITLLMLVPALGLDVAVKRGQGQLTVE